MIAIVQAQAGNRFIGEIADTAADCSSLQAGETATLLWPMAYIEKAGGPNGQTTVAMPPPILAVPIPVMSLVVSIAMILSDSSAAQLIAAYKAAVAPVKAAVTGIIPASASALRHLEQQKPRVI